MEHPAPALQKLLGLLAAPLLASALLGATACSQSASSDESLSDLLGDKSDSLLDLAKDIELGETVTGEVGGDNLILYKLRLTTGDRLHGHMEVLSGDLSPDFVLVTTSDTIHSDSFDVGSGSLDKNYTIEESGLYFIAARAFQGQGSGRYEFQLDCAGGSCAGEITDFGPLSAAEVDECLDRAQTCMWRDMKPFNGAVGPARAQDLLEDCLVSVSSEMDDPTNCTRACDDDVDEADTLCEALVRDVQFFADASDQCIDDFDFCLGMCLDLSRFMDGDDDSLFGHSFSMCYELGFNGDCVNYAMGMETCGGDIQAGTSADEEHLCINVDGVFSDDISDICEF